VGYDCKGCLGPLTIIFRPDVETVKDILERVQLELGIKSKIVLGYFLIGDSRLVPKSHWLVRLVHENSKSLKSQCSNESF